MEKYKQVGLSLPLEMLQKIDKARGKVPRSVWIVDLLEKAMRKQ